MERHVWSLVHAFMSYLEEHWREPDQGLWEVRGPRRQFVHSKIMCWVAADRALQMWKLAGRTDNVERWRAMRKEVHREVCRDGWNEEKGSFVQYYGAHVLDASALLIPRVGFLPVHDPRVLGTVEAVRTLDHRGFLRRYASRDHEMNDVDGLRGSEGAFLACSMWMADALAVTGRQDEARAVFERVLDVRNDVGLLSEEWDPVTRRQLGNTPQAFSHIALVNTAFTLREAAGGTIRPESSRPGPTRQGRKYSSNRSTNSESVSLSRSMSSSLFLAVTWMRTPTRSRWTSGYAASVT